MNRRCVSCWPAPSVSPATACTRPGMATRPRRSSRNTARPSICSSPPPVALPRRAAAHSGAPQTAAEPQGPAHLRDRAAAGRRRRIHREAILAGLPPETGSRHARADLRTTPARRSRASPPAAPRRPTGKEWRCRICVAVARFCGAQVRRDRSGTTCHRKVPIRGQTPVPRHRGQTPVAATSGSDPGRRVSRVSAAGSGRAGLRGGSPAGLAARRIRCATVSSPRRDRRRGSAAPGAAPTARRRCGWCGRFPAR